MNDFLREIEVRHMFFRNSLKFYSDNYFIRFLKVLTFLIFIWPTLALSLILFVLSAINVFVGIIPLLGLAYIPICGIFAFLVEVMYKLVNLPEKDDYCDIVNYLADQMRQQM